MVLAAYPRSVSTQSGFRPATAVGSQRCRRVVTRAADFEEYVLDLQSSIKSEAGRLEADSGKAVTFKDDRCEHCKAGVQAPIDLSGPSVQSSE